MQKTQMRYKEGMHCHSLHQQLWNEIHRTHFIQISLIPKWDDSDGFCETFLHE